MIGMTMAETTTEAATLQDRAVEVIIPAVDQIAVTIPGRDHPTAAVQPLDRMTMTAPEAATIMVAANHRS